MKRAELVLMIVKSIYVAGLRHLLLEMVEKTPEKWDDSLIRILDSLLEYPADNPI